MPKLTLVSGSNRDQFTPENTAEQLVNCFAEPSAPGARSQFRIRTCLGEESVTPSQVTNSGTLRAIKSLPGNKGVINVYALMNGRLWEWEWGASVTDIGAVTDDANANMDVNNGNITIAADGDYWVYDGASITKPGSGLLTNVGSVTYFSGYTVLTEDDGQRFEWTDAGDPTTRNALNFATADARPDPLVRAASSEGQLWLFGTSSAEIWYLTGNSGANAFARIPGSTIYTGLRQSRLITQIEDRLMFVGDDDRVYITTGTEIQRVSNSALESRLRTVSPTDLFTYEFDGHTFGVVRFASGLDAGTSWEFNFSTGLWNERESSEGSGWSTQFSVETKGVWYGARSTGTLYKFEDNGQRLGSIALKQTMTSVPFYNEGQQFSVSELEFLCEMGGSEGVSLEISKDGGNTFSSAITKSTGATQTNRIVYRALGVYRNFTARLSMSPGEPLVMYSDANMRLS